MSLMLGLAGLNGAGKGEIARFLEQRSFVAVSLSDVLRDELKIRGLSESREGLISLGRELREREGAGALAKRVRARMAPDRNYVVDSIRHPAEVEVLRNAGRRFLLLWVDAREEIRLRRLLERARPGDPQTSEELRHLERRELGSADASAQQLLAVREVADEVILNEGGLSDLHEQVKSILHRSLHFERPSWDDYFMDVARVVASRSNCVKRKVAAVVTVDKRIVSTGYNGTPRGLRNCNEGGCPRCNSFGPGGADLGECLCSHGEENAITQAAYHGVSLRGATLYSTFCPCLLCTKMIINSGIAEVVYSADYPMGDVSQRLLREAGVQVRQAGPGHAPGGISESS